MNTDEHRYERRVFICVHLSSSVAEYSSLSVNSLIDSASANFISAHPRLRPVGVG